MRDTTLSEMDLSAYMDGEIGPDEAAEIEMWLEQEPKAQAQLDAMTRHKDALSEALEALDPETINLKTVALERKLARAIHRQMPQPRRTLGFGAGRFAMQAVAACVLVAFGWWGHASMAPSSSQVQALALVPEYVSEAVGAHDVFGEDLVRPVEFSGNAVDSASEWFSSKLGIKVVAPDLAGRGLNLVGARLLGTKEGPLLQFIYEGPTGERLSLILAKHPKDRPVYALQMVDYPDQAVGYWSTRDLDYALVAKARSAEIASIAEEMAKDI